MLSSCLTPFLTIFRLYLLPVTHLVDSGINGCVQTRGSEPCLSRRAITATDMNSGMRHRVVGYAAMGREEKHKKRACQRDLKATSIRQLTVKRQYDSEW